MGGVISRAFGVETNFEISGDGLSNADSFHGVGLMLPMYAEANMNFYGTGPSHSSFWITRISSQFHNDSFLDGVFQALSQPNASQTSGKFIEELTGVSSHQLTALQEMDCCICQDNFLGDAKAAKLPCNHYFHDDCIKLWLHRHNTCPICRYQLPVEGRRRQ